MHELVAALGRRGRRLQGPEHRDGQGERHGDGVRGMSRYLRMAGVYGAGPNASGSCRLGRSRLSGKRRQIRGLGVPIRARVRAGDLQTLAFDFPNQLRYNICYTIL